MTEPPAPSPPPAPGAADDPVAILSGRLGIALGDRGTALLALTHRSFVNERRGEGQGDNERLEFLGDAVVDLAVSHLLVDRFPAASEGELSKLRAAMVDEHGLAELARSIDLGGLLRLGRGEEQTGGRDKPSLLADAMEAVVAAVYLEAGLPAVLSLLARHLQPVLARADEGALHRDFKTAFQELAQGRRRASPRYRVVGERGPEHAKIFEVEVELLGAPLGRATGRSKKDAEQAAARVAIEALRRELAAGGEETSPPAPAGPPASPGGPLAGQGQRD